MTRHVELRRLAQRDSLGSGVGGCPVHRRLRPRAEEAGRISSTRLLQLPAVERLPRAKNESGTWYPRPP